MDTGAMTNWYVITGSPSSGKTTVLNEVSKLGYTVYPEAARVFINQEMAKGKILNEIRNDEAEFQKKVLEIKINVEKNTPKDKVVFFDRAIPDSIAYFQICGLDQNEVLKFCERNTYKKVFFFEELPFDQDYARSEDIETIGRLNKLLKEGYEKLGYKVIDIPAMSTAERTKMILKEVEI